jgi:hypothetical protein
MGGLVSTVGTRYLINQFNRAFSSPRIEQLRTDPPMHAVAGGSSIAAGSAIMDYFNDPAAAVDLLWLTQNMTHAHSRRGDNRCFLPEDSGRSANVELRWRYFLTRANPNVLTQPNHGLIKAAIYRGLSHGFSRIEFDCIDVAQEGGAAVAQTVLSATEYDDHGKQYLKIVLVTPPIDPNRGGAIGGLPALDKQPNEP